MTDGVTENLCFGCFFGIPEQMGVTPTMKNTTYTICPDVAGRFVNVDFLSFDVQANQDFLSIYNGPSAASPLINTFSNANFPPGFSVRSTDASGCFDICIYLQWVCGLMRVWAADIKLFISRVNPFNLLFQVRSH